MNVTPARSSVVDGWSSRQAFGQLGRRVAVDLADEDEHAVGRRASDRGGPPPSAWPEDYHRDHTGRRRSPAAGRCGGGHARRPAGRRGRRSCGGARAPARPPASSGDRRRRGRRGTARRGRGRRRPGRGPSSWATVTAVSCPVASRTTTPWPASKVGRSTTPRAGRAGTSSTGGPPQARHQLAGRRRRPPPRRARRTAVARRGRCRRSAASSAA